MTMQTRSRSSKSSNSEGETPSLAPSQSKKKERKEKARWTFDEEAKLIDVLAESDAPNHAFKDPVFRAAAEALLGLREKGGIKDAASCRSKWKSVCTFFMRVLPLF
jgi:hypothetical protein